MRMVKIADLAELPEGASRKFLFTRDGVEFEGFVACFQGKIVAYENTCRHVPISLDYGDDKFFTADGQNFVCQTHGALYEPLTGRCIGGPCAGLSLKPIAIVVERGGVWRQLGDDE